MLDAVKRAPYYDDYEEEGKVKQYTQLLAVPGRVAQAREITQIQSTVKDIIKNIGDSIFRDGNIIEGCQVSIQTDFTSGAKIAKVSAGKVYVGGMVLPVEQTSVSISGVGRETIGVKLVEEIVTHEDDPTLRDPAQSYANYQLPGCDRLKSYIKVVVNDPSSSTIASLIDGNIAIERYAAEYGVLNQTLARRTHDESGSYIVHGLNVSVEKHPTEEDSFNVVVESGKAYVLGYELGIPAPRRLKLPRSLETTTIHSGVMYTGGETTSLSDVPYISNISSVIGQRRKTINQTIQTIGSQLVGFPVEDEYDVVSIESVVQGITTYTYGTDYRLTTRTDGTNRFAIEWLSGRYPVAGSPYTVTYIYRHEFVKDQDYVLYRENSRQGIKWVRTESEGVPFTPIQGTSVDISYELYLSRKDVIYLDQSGNIDKVLGTPGIYGSEILPEAPINTLPLAYIMSPPSGEISQDMNLKISVSNIGLTRFTMSDIQRLLDRIRTIEYDQAVLTLNEVSKMYYTENAKKGIWVDPLIDLSRIDYYYTLPGTTRGYDAAIDLDSNLCYLPVKSTTYDAGYDKTLGRTATLDKVGDPVVVISQNNATTRFQVNPYSVFPQLPEISIDPAVDVWIEDSFIEIPVSRTSSEVISSSTRHISSQRVLGSVFEAYTDTNTSHVDTVVNNRVSTDIKESVISSKAITYIRQRTINVSGRNFYPRLDNIRCYFDGVELPLTPTGDSEAGTAPNTVKADITGSFTAAFEIPKDRILTGIREVRLEADELPNTVAEEYRGYYEKYAIALYQASGTARTIQRTVTTLTTVLLNRVTTVESTTYIDPVGQTFVLDRMTMVSGINVYFADAPKGDSAASVTCDIREVVNGTITSTILGHRTLSADEVVISSDSSKPTTFSFDDPVLLEGNKEYAFVIRSTSPDYWLWVADLGENDILTGEPVLYNPYLIGVMMSSSNNSSWTNHQTTDIKFQLLADNYTDSTTIQFDNIHSTEEFSRVYLLAESIIPTGTSITWEYSLDAGLNYSVISPYNLTHLSDLHNDISLRATLRRTSNTNLSPILALDSVGATLSCYDNTGHSYYIGKEISNLSDYTTVDIVLDTFLPVTTSDNTKIRVFVVNSTSTKPVEADEVSSSDLDYGWKEKVYQVKFNQASNNCRVLIKLETNSTSGKTYTHVTPSFRRLRAIMS